MFSEFETESPLPMLKARAPRRRDAGQAHVEARARALTSALTLWLQRIGDDELERALSELPGRMKRAEKVEKASRKDTKATRDLLDLLSKYGVAQARDAATRVGRASGLSVRASADSAKILAPGVLRDYLAAKTVLLQGLPESTRADVRESVRRLIDEAMREDPRPSTGDLARRIRNQFHGGAGQGGERLAVETTSLPTGTTEAYSTDRGTMYAISSERAAAIARTELAQIENTATFATVESLGAETIQWIAVTSDRRSGDRGHWEMNGEKVKVGEKFELPSGAKLRYPGDPEAPIGETINCRCSIRAASFGS